MQSSGISLFTLLGVLFIGLKLTHVIDWSWWLVLLPLYGGLVLFMLMAFILVVLVWLGNRRYND